MAYEQPKCNKCGREINFIKLKFYSGEIKTVPVEKNYEFIITPSGEKTEKGQWLHANSYEQMMFDIVVDNASYGYRINIHAWLRDDALTYYKLKWS